MKHAREVPTVTHKLVPYLAVSEETVFPMLPEIGKMPITSQKQVAGHQYTYVHVDWQHLQEMRTYTNIMTISPWSLFK